ncbi:MBL fold metallo-hydrolase [Paenibacillus marinisediminis]
MRMTKAGYVTQLSFMPNLFPVNCYLVEEESDLTLIDAALPYSWKGIIRAAARIGKPIGRIVLTHAHSDHIGALSKLKQELPHVEVIISERDARLLRGDTTLLPGEPETPIRGGVPKVDMAKADRLISHGERIGSLEAIQAPGHTPGSFAFLDTRNRALIAGDAFQIRGGIAVSGYKNWSFPFPALATWHYETAIASAKRLIRYRPSLLAVGHGIMQERPEGLMEKAIIQAEHDLEKRMKHATKN